MIKLDQAFNSIFALACHHSVQTLNVLNQDCFRLVRKAFSSGSSHPSDNFLL